MLKLVFPTFLLISSLHLAAQEKSDDDWGDDWGEEKKASALSITGFSEAAYGQFLQSNVVEHDYALSELRNRVEITYELGRFLVAAKGDLTLDSVSSDNLWQTRELNISGRLTDNIDIKAGRQILTWGTGEYLFLNDLFPKDWQSFFAGREDEYLKRHSDSVKLSYFWNKVAIDLVLTPEFNADNYLTGERFSFFSPQQNQQVAPDEQFLVEQTSDGTIAARISTTLFDIDTAVYYNKGFWNTPQGMQSNGVAYFPEMESFGFSAQGQLGPGLLNAEWSYYRSSEDAEGTNPLVANSQARYLIGYQQELVKNLNWGMQLYLEKTKHYQAMQENNPFAMYATVENRTLITQRFRYAAMQQKLTLGLFLFYSPSDDDWYARPTVNYRYSDRWTFSMGANLFNGKNTYSFFGQHRDNSNAYLRIRYNFER